jgi:hypothetical protein
MTMFNPSTADVRRFFCDTWRKHRDNLVLSPIEAIALDWILEHPEYNDELVDAEAAIARVYSVEDGRTNPFLHLSMHLAIAEQLSIDQPAGIRAAFQALRSRLGSEHDAAHEVMECLGQVIWNAQRSSSAMAPDELNASYLECLARRAERAT